jgi:hypothetical protein
MRECDNRLEREKLRRKTSGVNIGVMQARSECYEELEARWRDI